MVGQLLICHLSWDFTGASHIRLCQCRYAVGSKQFFLLETQDVCNGMSLSNFPEEHTRSVQWHVFFDDILCVSSWKQALSVGTQDLACLLMTA